MYEVISFVSRASIYLLFCISKSFFYRILLQNHKIVSEFFLLTPQQPQVNLALHLSIVILYSLHGTRCLPLIKLESVLFCGSVVPVPGLHIISSVNHGKAWRSPGLTPVPAGTPRAECPGPHPGSFWSSPRREDSTASRQPLPALHHLHRKNMFLDVQSESPVFCFMLVALFLLLSVTRKSLSLSSCTLSLGIYRQ